MKAFDPAPPFVLREYLRDASAPGLALVAADTAQAEEALLATLASLGPGALLCVEFDGVRIASAAARRLLRRALLRLSRGELEDRYLVLGDLGDSTYNVHVMLLAEKLVAVERTREEGPLLRGHIDESLRSTYEYLQTVETATAAAVKEHFGLATIAAATNRLAGLSRLALARRVGQRTVPGGGREFVYAGVG